MEDYTKIDHIQSSPDVPIEKIKSNILDAESYGLKSITELFTGSKEESIAIVGGGPSLESQLHKLVNYESILLCGSVHDYFAEEYGFCNQQNIYSIICDPDPIMAKYIQKWDERVIYLVASQCDQEVFSTLALVPKKYLWDCAGPAEFNNELFVGAEKLIVGGCTVGTRAIGMAIAMGYRKLHLFGFDTCLTNTYKHHAYEFNDPERESLGNITELRLDDPKTGKKFICAGYMVAQIMDFQWMLQNFADKLDIQVFGGGALAYILEKGREKMVKHKEAQENGTRS